ncbi:hypothetical protein ACVWWR_002711 [Bradyrhizobium sp. LM3.2]
MKRLEDLAQLLRPPAGGVTPGTTTSGNTLPATNDPISLFERLLSLVNKTAPMPGPVTPTSPAPVNQLKQVVDLLSTLLNKDGKPVLGQVNGALGDTIGKMLDGKKTALGIGGSLITALLSSVTASPNAGGIAGLLGTIVSAVPGLGQFAMPDLPGTHGLGRARQAGEVGPRHRAAAEGDDVTCGDPSRRLPMAGPQDEVAFRGAY